MTCKPVAPSVEVPARASASGAMANPEARRAASEVQSTPLLAVAGLATGRRQTCRLQRR